MIDPNDLRKVETWLRDCKADLWMAECCEDAADDIDRLPAMLTRAFYEGFSFTREGWNGECAFDHLAPDGLTLEEMAAITVSAILADHDAAPAASGNTPTLTDAEREAVYRAEARLRAAYVPDDETAATLRKLLARLA